MTTTVIIFAVLSAVALSSAASTTESPLWFEVQDAALLDHEVSFQLYAAHAAEATSTTTGDDLHERLAALRQAAVSSRSGLEAALAAIGAPGTCQRGWDSLHCPHTPVRSLAADFVRCAALRVYASAHHPHRHVAATNQSCVLAWLRPFGIDHVRGLDLYDFRRKPRHMSAFRSPAGAPAAPAQPQAQSSAGAAVAGPTSALASWPTSGSAPTILDVQQSPGGVNQVLIAVQCADGSTASGTSAQRCPAAQAQPQSIALTLTGDGITGSMAVVVPLSTATCGTLVSNFKNYVNPYTDTSSDARFASALVCMLPVNKEVPGGYVSAAAATRFADGTASASNAAASFIYGGKGSPMRYFLGNNVGLSDIRTWYDIDGRLGVAAAEFNTIISGIIAFTSSTDRYTGLTVSDVERFLADNGQTFTPSMLKFINRHDNVAQRETTLDLELIMGLVPSSQAYLWNVEFGPGTAFADYLDAFIYWASNVTGSDSSSAFFANRYPATVWSISWGSPWHDDFLRTDRYFSMMDRSGMTIVAASGDQGVAEDPDPRNLNAEVLFPACSPYVVAVGATSFLGPSEVVASALDANLITSGGGYSQYTRPAYQVNVSSILNNNQRAIPDVSAVGASILIIESGAYHLAFGTSASAPIVGAVLNLVNLLRARNGTAPLANALDYLYRGGGAGTASSAFRDVTIGNNCAGRSLGIPANFKLATGCFQAASGWDASTGLGSPIFSALTGHPSSSGGTSGGSPPSKAEPLSRTALIGIGVGGAAVIVAVIAFCFCRRQPSHATDTQYSEMGMNQLTTPTHLHHEGSV